MVARTSTGTTPPTSCLANFSIGTCPVGVLADLAPTTYRSHQPVDQRAQRGGPSNLPSSLKQIPQSLVSAACHISVLDLSDWNTHPPDCRSPGGQDDTPSAGIAQVPQCETAAATPSALADAAPSASDRPPVSQPSPRASRPILPALVLRPALRSSLSTSLCVAHNPVETDTSGENTPSGPWASGPIAGAHPHRRLHTSATWSAAGLSSSSGRNGRAPKTVRWLDHVAQQAAARAEALSASQAGSCTHWMTTDGPTSQPSAVHPGAAASPSVTRLPRPSLEAAELASQPSPVGAAAAKASAPFATGADPGGGEAAEALTSTAASSVSAAPSEPSAPLEAATASTEPPSDQPADVAGQLAASSTPSSSPRAADPRDRHPAHLSRQGSNSSPTDEGAASPSPRQDAPSQPSLPLHLYLSPPMLRALERAQPISDVHTIPRSDPAKPRILIVQPPEEKLAAALDSALNGGLDCLGDVDRGGFDGSWSGREHALAAAYGLGVQGVVSAMDYALPSGGGGAAWRLDSGGLTCDGGGFLDSNGEGERFLAAAEGEGDRKEELASGRSGRASEYGSAEEQRVEWEKASAFWRRELQTAAAEVAAVAAERGAPRVSLSRGVACPRSGGDVAAGTEPCNRRSGAGGGADSGYSSHCGLGGNGGGGGSVGASSGLSSSSLTSGGGGSGAGSTGTGAVIAGISIVSLRARSLSSSYTTCAKPYGMSDGGCNSGVAAAWRQGDASLVHRPRCREADLPPPQGERQRGSCDGLSGDTDEEDDVSDIVNIFTGRSSNVAAIAATSPERPPSQNHREQVSWQCTAGQHDQDGLAPVAGTAATAVPATTAGAVMSHAVLLTRPCSAAFVTSAVAALSSGAAGSHRSGYCGRGGARRFSCGSCRCGLWRGTSTSKPSAGSRGGGGAAGPAAASAVGAATEAAGGAVRRAAGPKDSSSSSRGLLRGMLARAVRLTGGLVSCVSVAEDSVAVR